MGSDLTLAIVEHLRVEDAPRLSHAAMRSAPNAVTNFRSDALSTGTAKDLTSFFQSFSLEKRYRLWIGWLHRSKIGRKEKV